MIFETERARIARLTENDAPAMENLYSRCDDFFRLVMGHPPGPAEVQSAFIGLPEGKTYDDKYLAGIFGGDGDLVGDIDVIGDHPEDGTWHIAAFLLDPAHRDAGLGLEVFERLMDWASERGALALRVIVAEQDRDATTFWMSAGFHLVDRVPRRQGLLDNICGIMVRAVPTR